MFSGPLRRISFVVMTFIPYFSIRYFLNTPIVFLFHDLTNALHNLYYPHSMRWQEAYHAYYPTELCKVYADQRVHLSISQLIYFLVLPFLFRQLLRLHYCDHHLTQLEKNVFSSFRKLLLTPYHTSLQRLLFFLHKVNRWAHIKFYYRLKFFPKGNE